MDQTICLITHIDELAEFTILFRMTFSIGDHLLDLVIGQSRRCLDDDILALARCLVLGRDIQDAVRIDVKGDLNLWQASRRRRNIGEVETAERFIVHRTLTLTLQYVNCHSRLVVVCRREYLFGVCRNRRILIDQLGHYAAEGLDTERQWCNVQQQHVFNVTC